MLILTVSTEAGTANTVKGMYATALQIHNQLVTQTNIQAVNISSIF